MFRDIKNKESAVRLIARNNKRSKASSTIEYITLVVFIWSALYVFRGYIFRGLSGKWREAGDLFGKGRQYDPRAFGPDGNSGGTVECFLDYQHGGGWVNERCYDRHCDCSTPEDAPGHQEECHDCLRETCPCPGEVL